jgi:hypothetical protein
MGNWKERTTDVLVGHCARERVFADESDDKLERAGKPCTEPGHLCLEPAFCFTHVLTCKIAEDDG